MRAASVWCYRRDCGLPPAAVCRRTGVQCCRGPALLWRLLWRSRNKSKCVSLLSNHRQTQCHKVVNTLLRWSIDGRVMQCKLSPMRQRLPLFHGSA